MTQRPLSRQPLPPHAQKVFTGVFFDTYHWQQTMFDGSTRTFEKAKKKDGAMVFAVLPNKNILVTKQTQPGTKEFISLPGGHIEENEEPQTAALRELQEETGYTSNKTTLLCAHQPLMHLDFAIFYFIAYNCTKTKQHQNPEGVGEKITTIEYSFEELTNWICSPQCNDPKLLHLFYQAKLDIKKMKVLKELFKQQS